MDIVYTDHQCYVAELVKIVLFDGQHRTFPVITDGLIM